MLTPFQTKKWTHLFNLYDLDRDGTVSRSDYELKVEAVAKSQGVASGTPEYAAIERSVMADWDHVRKTADKDGNGKVQLQEWLQHGAVIISDEQMYATLGKEVDAMFSQFDKDGDGVLSRQEIIDMTVIWGVPEAEMVEVFPKLDINGDGRISKDEYKKLLAQFHKSDEPSDPGNYLFGQF